MSAHRIVWADEKFSTGIDEIDKQHQELVDRANKVLDAINAGYVDGALLQPINELITSAHNHFAFEEKLLADNNYPKLVEHIQDHIILIEQLINLKKNVIPLTAKRIKAEIFSAFLVDMVEQHLVHADQNLLALISAN